MWKSFSLLIKILKISVFPQMKVCGKTSALTILFSNISKVDIFFRIFFTFGAVVDIFSTFYKHLSQRFYNDKYLCRAFEFPIGKGLFRLLHSFDIP